jgi:hypothetical protein
MFQQSMSFEQIPVLSHVIINFKMLMSEWERIAEQHECLKPWIKIGLHWATKYYIRMDDTEAYVVTMCKFVNRSSIQWAPKVLQCFAVSDCLQCGALWSGNHT